MVLWRGANAFLLIILLWHHRLYTWHNAHRRRALLQNLLHRSGLPDPHAACDDAPALKQQTYCRHRDTAFDAACHRMQYFHHRAGWHSPYIFFYTYAELRHEFWELSPHILDSFEEEFGIRLGLFLTYIIVCSLIGIISNIVTLFGCVSLGQLYAKHRIVGAIAAYFVLQFVLMIFGNLTTIPMYTKLLTGAYAANTTVFDILSPTMNLSLLTTVLLAVGMYFVNLHMMTKKLNLE